MKLTELFSNNKQIAEGTKAQPQSGGNAGIVNRQIHAMKPGQTFQGEVLARGGGEVQIKLAEDLIIKARVDQNIYLELGKSMTFEVKNNGQALTLLPLYTNTAMDANVLKALNMANLPIQPQSIEMTEQMMHAGLSIDKNSLQQVFRECNLYPESSVEDIIDLHKLSIPVNETNLAQLSSYKNLTHQLLGGLNAVADSIVDTIHSMVQNGETEEAARLLLDISRLISEEQEISYKESENTGKAEYREAAYQSPEHAGVEYGTPEQKSTEHVNIEHMSAEYLSAEQTDIEYECVKYMDAERMGMEQADAGQPSMKTQETPSGNIAEGIAAATKDMGYADLQNYDGEALQRLLRQGIQKRDTDLLQNLLENKEIGKKIKNALHDMWTIQPQDVADEKKVKQLYERLDRQLKGLAGALENAGQTHSETYRATGNLTQNLDFMQQLNQTYTYMQLPLRLQQGNDVHGELYVYSKKKHLASSEGKITALLHLDMEHLGPLDVYVAMQNEKVSTKFYVKDDSMLDFLSEHMDILTRRLRQRGYDYSCEMLSREAAGEKEEQSVIHRLLEKETQVPIVQYAFDVRT